MIPSDPTQLDKAGTSDLMLVDMFVCARATVGAYVVLLLGVRCCCQCMLRRCRCPVVDDRLVPVDVDPDDDLYVRMTMNDVERCRYDVCPSGCSYVDVASTTAWCWCQLSMLRC